MSATAHPRARASSRPGREGVRTQGPPMRRIPNAVPSCPPFEPHRRHCGFDAGHSPLHWNDGWILARDRSPAYRVFSLGMVPRRDAWTLANFLRRAEMARDAVGRERTEDRGSQMTFSALGQQTPIPMRKTGIPISRSATSFEPIGAHASPGDVDRHRPQGGRQGLWASQVERRQRHRP